MSDKSNHPVSILVVDDDEIDHEILVREFKTRGIDNPIVHAYSGEEALQIMRGTGEGAIQKPFIVLLDLKMPRMNGHEFLHEVREDPSIHNVTVIVLTSSDNQRDRIEAYEKHVAAYMLKSTITEDIDKLFQLLDVYMHYVLYPDGS